MTPKGGPCVKQRQISVEGNTGRPVKVLKRSIAFGYKRLTNEDHTFLRKLKNLQ